MTAPRCSDASRASGESLAGTATTVERWLLLEVPGTWPRDVGSEGALPGPAEVAARAWLERAPRSRLLFLRRPGRRGGRPAVYVVEADGSSAEPRRLDVASLDELADVDLACDGDPVDGALVLVCAHGSRDSCCALLGTPVFGALSGVGGAETWLSSHQGGHRFAANVLILPAAIQLGRVEAGEAARVVGDALAGRIDLERYRGRSFHEPVAQAAEIAIRKRERLAGVDDLALVAVEGARVRFRTGDGREHEAVVDEVDGPIVPASCGADPEPQAELRARLA